MQWMLFNPVSLVRGLKQLPDMERAKGVLQRLSSPGHA